MEDNNLNKNDQSEQKSQDIELDILPDQLNDDDQDEYNEGLSEADIPIHLSKKRKAKKTSSRKKKKKRKKKTERKPFNLFEIMSAVDDSGPFKPFFIGKTQIKYWPAIVLFVLVALIVTIVMVNGQINTVKQNVSVIGLDDDLENYRILVMSDLNGKRFGDEQSLLLRAIDGVKYNIIICVGDMVGEDGDPEPFYEFLDGLPKASRVYFTCGDSDPGPYVAPRSTSGTLRELILADWILGAIERGANYVDAPMKITVGESYFWLTPTSFLNIEATKYRADWREQMEQEEDGVITGLDSDYNTLPLTSYRYLLARKFFDAANEMKPTDLVIGLSHIVPDDDFIASAATHDGDEGVYMVEPELILSGHYCGGMWQLPFYTTLYVPNRMLPRYGWLPDPEDVQGLSQIGESQVYITAGLSSTSALKLLPFRVFNNPEIVQITLTASLPESMLD